MSRRTVRALTVVPKSFAITVLLGGRRFAESCFSKRRVSSLRTAITRAIRCLFISARQNHIGTDRLFPEYETHAEDKLLK